MLGEAQVIAERVPTRRNPGKGDRFTATGRDIGEGVAMVGPIQSEARSMVRAIWLGYPESSAKEKRSRLMIVFSSARCLSPPSSTVKSDEGALGRALTSLGMEQDTITDELQTEGSKTKAESSTDHSCKIKSERSRCQTLAHARDSEDCVRQGDLPSHSEDWRRNGLQEAAVGVSMSGLRYSPTDQIPAFVDMGTEPPKVICRLCFGSCCPWFEVVRCALV